ncbi:hypothetical protein TSOC_012656 [Tetrabaena socialis]|uniref:CBM20 domain-containing protein n=1 Tax=Tetrabaena socialis TaxID=47790 RepID=A0A2J7ZMG0_9CHLO|nr:hypothetical protein TSOC_012656 [Tetrabaena socialis]|eukprot:PNH01456.1 hypothetical protein TSOC_012656 [Tetrabaena socialis]
MLLLRAPPSSSRPSAAGTAIPGRPALPRAPAGAQRSAAPHHPCLSSRQGAVVRFRDDRAPDEVPDATQTTRDGARQMVPVILKYGKRCNFGEAYAVVGSVPELGSWDPAKAARMQWTPGDVWEAVVRLPVDTDVQYKYVRIKEKGGLVAWEGCEQGNGARAGDLSNLCLRVKPKDSLMFKHGVEVRHRLPAECADIAGEPLPDATTTKAGPAPAPPPSTNGRSDSRGLVSGAVELATKTLAAIESHIPALSGGLQPAGVRLAGQAEQVLAGVELAGGSGSSWELAASMIAAGPAAAAVSEATMDRVADEGGSVPVVLPVAQPAPGASAAAREAWARGGGAHDAPTMDVPPPEVPPPAVTAAGAAAEAPQVPPYSQDAGATPGGHPDDYSGNGSGGSGNRFTEFFKRLISI